MDNVIQTIKSQTDIDDETLIEETYKECMCDMVKTIMQLMQIKDTQRNKPARTQFDAMREILAEKEKIYQELTGK